jgi:ABC-type thiamin/hydroxymethylpyrimidine transport system permease subunit
MISSQIYCFRHEFYCQTIYYECMKKIIIVTFLAIIIFIGWIVWYKNTSVSEPTNTQTLSQGTQVHIGEISIGLSSITDTSAILVIHKDGLTDSISKSVVAGDTVEIYGYTIDVISVKKSFNPSLVPGSNHGYVKFTITNR